MRFKEKLNEYKTYLIFVIIILGLITFNIYTLTLIDYDDTEEIIPIKTKENQNTKIKVDIKGQINAPGVYELTKGERVNDLINKAGGITKNADTTIINLSKKLDDEMVVIIYTKEEVKKLNDGNIEKVTNICPKVNDACPEKQLETINEKENKVTETKGNNINAKLSLNKATIEELQTLSGIGDSAFEKIKDQITL